MQIIIVVKFYKINRKVQEIYKPGVIILLTFGYQNIIGLR